jgi:NitT/TauT family transport system substrate-binding protein
MTPKIISMTDWNSIGDAVVAGEVDIAFILAPYAMEIYNQIKNIKLVLFSHKSGSVIVANKKAKVKSLEDFKGKTVLIPYHLSMHHMLLDQLMRERGIIPGIGKDVMFEVIAPSQIPEVISWDEKGDIGGYIVAEPFGSQVIAEGNGELLYLSKDIWPNHPCCVVIVREEIAQKYPDAIHELTASLVKSGKSIKAQPDSAAKIGSAFLNQKYEVIHKVLTDPPDRLETTELMPVLEDLEKMQSYLTSTISAMSRKIELEKFVDLQFAKTAGAK